MSDLVGIQLVGFLMHKLNFYKGALVLIAPVPLIIASILLPFLDFTGTMKISLAGLVAVLCTMGLALAQFNYYDTSYTGSSSSNDDDSDKNDNFSKDNNIFFLISVLEKKKSYLFLRSLVCLFVRQVERNSQQQYLKLKVKI